MPIADSPRRSAIQQRSLAAGVHVGRDVPGHELRPRDCEMRRASRCRRRADAVNTCIEPGLAQSPCQEHAHFFARDSCITHRCDGRLQHRAGWPERSRATSSNTPSGCPRDEGASGGQGAATPCTAAPDDKPPTNQGSAPDAGSATIILPPRFDELVAATTQVSRDALFELFDALSPIEPSFMLGEWEGGVFLTGHPGEQQLKLVNWVGKRFTDEDDVNPIISRAANGSRKVNPVLGTARLRSVRYPRRFDCHDDSHDHIRSSITSGRSPIDLVVGAMDRKGDAFPLFFYLRRLPANAE